MENSFSFERFMTLNNDEIGKIFKSSPAAKWDDLNNREFEGINRLPLTKALTIHKFKKGFREINGNCVGYNLRIRQGGGYASFQVVNNSKGPVKHGFFEVKVSNSNCLLNYEGGDNPWYDPARFLKDELVKYENFFIGKAFAGKVFLTYFCLRT